MVKWFDALSLKWKLAVLSALTTAFALVLAGIITVYIETRTYQQAKLEELRAEANILAANIIGAVVFSDADAAATTLASLAANPEIERAAAYDGDNKLVGHFAKVPQDEAAIPTSAPNPIASIRAASATIVVPISQNGAAVGTVYLVARIQTMAARMAAFSGVVLTVAFISLGLVLPIAMRLNRAVTDPVEELEAKNAIIETTMANVDHGVLVADKNFRVAFVNDRHARLFDDQMGSLQIGMDLVAVLKQRMNNNVGSAAVIVKELEHYASTQSFRQELHLPDDRWIEYRQAPLPGGGFVRTYTDVTEERTVQQSLEEARARAEDADRAKSAFLAAMSHEIRTPMNGVIGLLELLHATPLNADQRQMVDIIRQSGNSLLDVINDILDYSKIEAGRMTVENITFDVVTLIETTAKTISGHTKSKTINVTCTVDPQIDWSVVGDPVRTRQVLLNLMGNALKFTEMGQIAVEAHAETVHDDRMVILFEVTDTGIGIPAEKMDRLFERFTQADYSTTRRYGGTGLGLSISKHLVELMGGEIGARSTPGQGSTFWFKIPFGRISAAERTAPFADITDSLRGQRVVVCDRIKQPSPVTTYLEAAGASVANAAGIGEIVERLYDSGPNDNSPQVVVLTVRIGEDSVSLLAAELVKRKGLQDVRVLLVLPHISASAAKPFAASNPSMIIHSPMSRGDLYQAVAALAGKEKIRKQVIATHLDYVPPSMDEAIAQGCLILVAEDNETNQFVISNQLRRLGYVAEFAGDGQEAWNLLRRSPGRHGLLLTDCHMPFMDGYQLTRTIRENERETGGHMPVIALTANALEGESDLCRAAGMDDYLSKPVQLSALDDRLRTWLPKAATLRRAATAQPPQEAPAVPPAPAVLAEAESKPPINLDQMAEFVGNPDPEYLRELLQIFWESIEETPGTFLQLTRKRDAKALGDAAHATKGAAASACAPDLAELCRRLEKAARSEHWDEIDAILPALSDAFDEVETFIATIVDKVPEENLVS